MKTPLDCLLIFILMYVSCQKHAILPEFIDLNDQEWAEVLDIKMKLGEVAEDSRCPVPDVVCVWEGRAKGIALVEINEITYDLVFEIAGLCDAASQKCGNSIDTLGYKFRFVDLAPYPDGNPPKSAYILSVEVSKH